MKRHNLIKSISVLLVFGNLLFSQEESASYYYHLKPEGNNYFLKQNWSFNSIGSFSVYTMNGKHTFEDFVKTNNFITNDTIQDFFIAQSHMTHDVVMNLNGDSILGGDNDLILSIFYGSNHNFQNKDSILTFMSTLKLSHRILPGHIKTNKLFVKLNMVTKLLQILYCLESETLCVTKLEEYNVGDIDFWTSKRKTFYTTPPNWMLVPKK